MSEQFPEVQEAPAAWVKRTGTALRDVELQLRRSHGAARRRLELEVLDAALAHREAVERVGGVAPRPGEVPGPWIRPLGCGHDGADRRCLACGRRACPACQPATGVQACAGCSGPVYRDDETLPPGGANPDNGDY